MNTQQSLKEVLTLIWSMGWLFSKKKESRVPAPIRRLPPMGEDKSTPVSKKDLTSQKLQEVAGLPLPEQNLDLNQGNNDLEFPVDESHFDEEQSDELGGVVEGNDLFLKVEQYRRMLGEVENLKKTLHKLDTLSKHIIESEFNEEESFRHLKTDIRNIHDHFLTIDKKVFKS